MNELMIYLASAVPVIVGIVEACKRSGFPSKFAGLLAIAVGIGGGLMYASYALQPYPLGAFFGLVSGLAAAGLYSGPKNALEK